MPPADSLMCPPKFTVPLQDLTIKDGEALNLTCAVKGDPEPNVTWSKNGEVNLPWYYISKTRYYELITIGAEFL